MVDLEPAILVLTDLVAGVSDEQLTAPTPCTETSLGDLLDHVDGLSLAFTAAATKPRPRAVPAHRPMLPASAPIGDRGLPQRLVALAAAWNEEAAWQG